jgi:hypothetical protein
MPAKSFLDPEQILKLNALIADVPNFVKRMGKDGQQIEAFWLDAQDAVKASKTDEERVLIFSSLMLVMLVAKNCTRKFSFDPFKPLRFKCDEIAKVLNFERYKRFRNL